MCVGFLPVGERFTMLEYGSESNHERHRSALEERVAR